VLGGLTEPKLGSAIYWSVWWLEVLAYCSVDLFAILSGYLGINSKKKSIYRVLELAVVVAFYCILITLVCRVVNIGNYSGWKRYVVYLFPYLFGRYWYIICYIPLRIIQPYINKMLLSLTEKQHAVICLIGVFFFGLVPVGLRNEMFAINRGYSFIWLLVCYVIGAYFKRRKPKNYSSTILVIVFWGRSAFLLCGNILLYCIRGYFYQYFIEYNSPFVLLMGISLLLLFKSMKLNKLRRMIASLSGLAFDVYIIHCHILIFDYVIRNRFEVVVSYPIPIMWILVIGIAIFVFLTLAVVGYVRMVVFEKCHINSGMRWIASKIDFILYKDF